MIFTKCRNIYMRESRDLLMSLQTLVPRRRLLRKKYVFDIHVKHSCFFFLLFFVNSCSGWVFSGLLRDKPLEICHTYPTMMKLGTVISYLEEIQKVYKTRDTSLEFHWHQHFFIFFRKSANFAILRNIDIDCILIHNF